MDNIEINLTRALTDFLDHNKQRSKSQQTAQEINEKALEKQQTKLESLEGKLENLHKDILGQFDALKSRLEESEKHNAELEKRLELSRKHEEETKKTLDGYKSDLQKMQTELSQWIDVTRLLSSNEVKNNDAEYKIQEELENLHKGQYGLSIALKKLQDKFTSIAPTYPSYSDNGGYRPPMRSPSASSYLNGVSSFSPVPPTRKPSFPSYLKQNNHQNNHPYETLDPNEEMSELSDLVERSKRGVDALNELHRSFEKSSSIFGDD